MKATIRNETVRTSNKGGSESVICPNSSSDFVNSSHNDVSVNTRIRIILAAFVLLEILDAALTFIGISQRGFIFEKNIFVRNFIMSFGFLPIAAIKVFVSAAFAVMINYSYGRFGKYGRMLLYLSVLLALIALYGASSSAYVLFF